LILDIFASHARSREGQLQVELAQLNYLLPRLTGKGSEMSRLGGKSGGGSSGGAGGGGAGRIGVRGPGEKKLETDRRRIRDRISKIKGSIEEVRQQRALRREARNAVPLGTVTLVGYTNAGKSTLFNALSSADVLVSDRMFLACNMMSWIVKWEKYWTNWVSRGGRGYGYSTKWISFRWSSGRSLKRLGIVRIQAKNRRYLSPR
jgi:GTP-binding protein HflX